MYDAGIGFGAINHPVDRDPVCCYTGVIKDKCPKCGRKDGEDGIKFERIRRITGYLARGFYLDGTMQKDVKKKIEQNMIQE